MRKIALQAITWCNGVLSRHDGRLPNGQSLYFPATK
jgi:hypothetical protein